MGGGKQPAMVQRGGAGKKPTGWAVALVWVVGLGVVGLCLLGILNTDSDLSVPAPATDERGDTVQILQAASTSQGICYGWRLTDGYEVVSVGSNAGDGTAVEDAPACPRWIEVSADVTYTPESSESSDSASIRLRGSADVEVADLYEIERGLDRFGLDEGVFIDDPGWAVTRAATTLPLLAAEAGLAAPAATPSADPSVAANPLPAAGNDFWRDRWGFLLATAALLLLAALFIAVGVRQRRRATAPGRGAVAGAAGRSGRELRAHRPAQRAGAGGAGRTRGKA